MESSKRLLKKEHPYGALLFGLLLICFALFFLKDGCVSDSNLIQMNGKLHNVSINISTHANRGGSESQRAELIFSLVGQKQSFSLAKNIGDEYSDEDYDWIKKRLKESESVSVWIRNNEVNIDMPKVFQISVNGDEVLLDKETVKTQHGPVVALLLILGSLTVVLFYWKVTRPDVFESVAEAFK